MVGRPTTGSDTSVTLNSQTTTSSSSSNSQFSTSNMASFAAETPSWSKMYGRSDRLKSYKSNYGRINTYDPISSRFRTEPTVTSERQSRFDTYGSTTMSRTRMSCSVDRDVDRDLLKSFGRASGMNVTGESSRRAYSVDRDVDYTSSYGGSTKVRPWREKLKLAEKKRRASDHGELKTALHRSYSQETTHSRTASSPRRSHYEPPDQSLDTKYERASRKSRAASMSRMGGSADRSYDYENIIASAKKRAASVSRIEVDDDDELEISVPIRGQRASSVSASARVSQLVEYEPGNKPSHATPLAQIEDHIQCGTDISSFVFRPGEKFEPERMKVIDLPSGRKARSYTTFSQYGHGDKREANNKINEVTLKTKLLEQSVSTLEDFVRRNRSYFPEETTIYQQIRFYQLDEAQLREIGESPDAEVYGVKVREKLVVPPGTDVAHILGRYYKSSDVDVEYSTNGVGPAAGHRRMPGDEYESVSQDHVEQNIRRQVEAEFDLRDKQRFVGQESYDLRSATQAVNRKDLYNHLSPHVSPAYIHSVYRDAGASYDDIYQRSGASTLTSPTASDIDIESIRSSASSRKRTYDQVPHFTAKLRNKQCMTGQTIKFNCSVSGLPFPEITWFKGNRVINEGGRFCFTNNYGLLSLEIQNVNKEDAGLYTIKAVNNEGECATSASLDVIELDTADRSSGAQKPYFVVEAANAVAEIGGRAIFEARATGKPVPSFKWYRDNIQVYDNAHVKMYEDQQGNTKLVISDVRAEDAGLYFLTAESKAGKAKCAATLRIVERGTLEDERRPRRSWSRETTPTLDLPPRKERGNKPYFIQAPPVEIKVKEGDALTLKCMVDGDPKPVVNWTRGTAENKQEIAKVTWCKGVRELQYTERHRVVTEGDHYMMQIKATTAYDRGQYIVVAENAVGRIHANCWVNVLPIDDDDEGDDIEFRRFKLELPELELEAIGKGEMGKQAPMFVKRLPRERTVSAGSSIEMHCHVREATPEVVTETEYSLKKTGKLELQEETIRIGADGTVTKKTEVVGLDTKPPRPQKTTDKAGESKAAAAKTDSAKTESTQASREASVEVTEVKPSESEVPVAIQMEPEPVVEAEKPEVKEEVKTEVKEEVKAVVKEEVKVEEKEEPQPVVEAEIKAELKEEVIKVEAHPEAKPEVKAEVKDEVKQEVKAKVEDQSGEIIEEVIQPTVVEKKLAPPAEPRTPSPEKEPSPVPQPSEPVKEPEATAEESAPAVVEEAIEPIAAEKVKEVVLPQEPEVSKEAIKSAQAPAVEKQEESAPVTEVVEDSKSAKAPAAPAAEDSQVPSVVVAEVSSDVPEVSVEVEAIQAPVDQPEPVVVVEESKPAEEILAPVEAVPEPAAAPTAEDKSAPEGTTAPEPAAETPTPAPEPAAETPTAAPEPTAEAPAPTPALAPEPVTEVTPAPVAEEAKAEQTKAVPEPITSLEKRSSVDQTDAPASPTLTSESEGGLPVFVEKLRNIRVPEGASATFSCEFNENSNASASWTKDGEALSSGGNVTVAAEGCLQTLTIQDISKADEGCYTCTAKNANGEATTSGSLTVETAKPSEEPVAATEEPKPEDSTVEETIETKQTSQPQDSDISEDSESDSDSDSDSEESSSEESSDSESDSEDILTETIHQQVNSKAAKLKTYHHGRMTPRLSALSHHDYSLSVISSSRHFVSDDPLLETSWHCEGRQ